ncbi:hypothetical protein SKAU_G00379740 [Synaphobranchus kaupii]|uniref:Uncharacterized protein n=1 Tax=Synaphobranchus kaupii TaxID=118154 RepID=A0A9Q1EDJ3_SYNKA|nr:hypothetical protein SKAU_G00379740 [Synaphobranchus kaupii]
MAASGAATQGPVTIWPPSALSETPDAPRGLASPPARTRLAVSRARLPPPATSPAVDTGVFELKTFLDTGLDRLPLCDSSWR